MKLESLFYVQNNQLIKKADNAQINLKDIKSYSFDELSKNITNDSFLKINLSWAQIELGEEVYNEEVLAELRNLLKKMEEANHFALITPIVDKEFTTPEQILSFITTFNHTARRIKDCVSMVGYELPKELLGKGFDSFTNEFIQTLAIKHSQYIYFINNNNINEFNLNERIAKTDIVLL